MPEPAAVAGGGARAGGSGSGDNAASKDEPALPSFSVPSTAKLVGPLAGIDGADIVKVMRSHGYCVIDRFAGRDVLAKALSEAKELNAGDHLSAQMSRIGHGDDEGTGQRKIRGDVVLWLKPGVPAWTALRGGVPGVATALNTLHNLGEKVSRALHTQRIGTRHNHLALQPLSSGAMLACYPAGGTGYVRHVDNPRGADGRKVTALWYMQDDWTPEDGGQLRIHMKNGTVDVDPIGDRVLVFWSEFVIHEVLPARRRDRYALSQWFTGVEHESAAAAAAADAAAAAKRVRIPVEDSALERLVSSGDTSSAASGKDGPGGGGGRNGRGTRKGAAATTMAGSEGARTHSGGGSGSAGGDGGGSAHTTGSSSTEAGEVTVSRAMLAAAARGIVDDDAVTKLWRALVASRPSKV